MLDEFRETAITWDKANRKVYEPLRVSAGDNKGRKLSVQVVNGGVIESLSGASLSLFWETKDKAYKGLDAFTVVDAAKGEFEIYYTTGMLSNEGTLNANLVLVDTSGRVVSEPFTITVFKGIDDEAVQSSDSFTALTEALIDISDLEQNYAPRLNDLTAQLQQTEQTLNAHLAVKGSGVSTDLPLTNGWVGTVRWRKSDGDVVTVEVDVAKSSSISPLNDIATLPASIRTFEKVLPVVSITTGDIEFLYINAEGVLRTPTKTTMQTDRSYHGVITYTI